eukprot:g55563.t1
MLRTNPFRLPQTGPRGLFPFFDPFFWDVSFVLNFGNVRECLGDLLGTFPKLSPKHSRTFPKLFPSVPQTGPLSSDWVGGPLFFSDVSFVPQPSLSHVCSRKWLIRARHDFSADKTRISHVLLEFFHVLSRSGRPRSLRGAQRDLTTDRRVAMSMLLTIDPWELALHVYYMRHQSCKPDCNSLYNLSICDDGKLSGVKCVPRKHPNPYGAPDDYLRPFDKPYDHPEPTYPLKPGHPTMLGMPLPVYWSLENFRMIQTCSRDMNPPAIARCLSVVNTCMFDAASCYVDNWKPSIDLDASLAMCVGCQTQAWLCVWAVRRKLGKAVATRVFQKYLLQIGPEDYSGDMQEAKLPNF